MMTTEDMIRHDAVISRGGDMIVVSQKTIAGMEENTRRMGEMILQLGTMIGAMQRRMDELEARQAAVTASHGEVKRIRAMIRSRADEICRENSLQDGDSPKIFRAAIKKDLLRRWQVKDLHDLPAAALPAAEKLIGNWTNIRLLMERRVST